MEKLRLLFGIALFWGNFGYSATHYLSDGDTNVLEGILGQSTEDYIDILYAPPGAYKDPLTSQHRPYEPTEPESTGLGKPESISLDNPPVKYHDVQVQLPRHSQGQARMYVPLAETQQNTAQQMQPLQPEIKPTRYIGQPEHVLNKHVHESSKVLSINEQQAAFPEHDPRQPMLPMEHRRPLPTHEPRKIPLLHKSGKPLPSHEQLEGLPKGPKTLINEYNKEQTDKVNQPINKIELVNLDGQSDTVNVGSPLDNARALQNQVMRLTDRNPNILSSQSFLQNDPNVRESKFGALNIPLSESVSVENTVQNVKTHKNGDVSVDKSVQQHMMPLDMRLGEENQQKVSAIMSRLHNRFGMLSPVIYVLLGEKCNKTPHTPDIKHENVMAKKTDTMFNAPMGIAQPPIAGTVDTPTVRSPVIQKTEAMVNEPKDVIEPIVASTGEVRTFDKQTGLAAEASTDIKVNAAESTPTVPVLILNSDYGRDSTNKVPNTDQNKLEKPMALQEIHQPQPTVTRLGTQITETNINADQISFIESRKLPDVIVRTIHNILPHEDPDVVVRTLKQIEEEKLPDVVVRSLNEMEHKEKLPDVVTRTFNDIDPQEKLPDVITRNLHDTETNEKLPDVVLRTLQEVDQQEKLPEVVVLNSNDYEQDSLPEVVVRQPIDVEPQEKLPEVIVRGSSHNKPHQHPDIVLRSLRIGNTGFAMAEVKDQANTGKTVAVHKDPEIFNKANHQTIDSQIISPHFEGTNQASTTPRTSPRLVGEEFDPRSFLPRSKPHYKVRPQTTASPIVHAVKKHIHRSRLESRGRDNSMSTGDHEPRKRLLNRDSSRKRILARPTSRSRSQVPRTPTQRPRQRMSRFSPPPRNTRGDNRPRTVRIRPRIIPRFNLFG